MKALIADSGCKTVDNISMAFNICLTNFELVTTDSDKQCLDMVKDNSPNMVILSDLASMPSSNSIKQIQMYPQVPVLVLSNIRDNPVVVKAFNIGDDGYMTKPFHQLEFLARVRLLLREKQSNKQYGYSS